MSSKIDYFGASDGPYVTTTESRRGTERPCPVRSITLVLLTAPTSRGTLAKDRHDDDVVTWMDGMVIVGVDWDR